jgi:hypothetical protein
MDRGGVPAHSKKPVARIFKGTANDSRSSSEQQVTKSQPEIPERVLIACNAARAKGSNFQTLSLTLIIAIFLRFSFKSHSTCKMQSHGVV